MEKFIAPKILTVDGKPSPCLCKTEGGVKTICEFCVQANLIIWERAEARGKNPRPGRLVNSLKKAQKTRVAKMMGVHRNTVHNILKSNKIPPKYARRFNRALEKGVSG